METNNVTLNKYLAMAGISSRRKAISEIKAGCVKINDIVVTDPACRVLPTDRVLYNGKSVKIEEKVYILLNKPEGFVTTVSDELNRPTVFDLIKVKSLNKRLFPVGRLDLHTTGLLLVTNDGDMAQKLSHPKFETLKVYQATLDHDLEYKDFEQIKAGLRLEDGMIRVDKIYFAKKSSKKKLVVEIHSGKNRIVRRIFKALGYNVTSLERIGYAGLVKKGLPKGYWRFLNKKEIAHLKSL